MRADSSVHHHDQGRQLVGVEGHGRLQTLRVGTCVHHSSPSRLVLAQTQRISSQDAHVVSGLLLRTYARTHVCVRGQGKSKDTYRTSMYPHLYNFVVFFLHATLIPYLHAQYKQLYTELPTALPHLG